MEGKGPTSYPTIEWCALPSGELSIVIQVQAAWQPAARDVVEETDEPDDLQSPFSSQRLSSHPLCPAQSSPPHTLSPARSL